MKIINGGDIKKLVENIPNDALVVIGQENDSLGRNDMKITSLEVRKIGFSDNNVYYAICVKPYESSNCLKFYN